MNQGIIAYLDTASLVPAGGGYISPGENIYSKLVTCNTLVMRIPYDGTILYIPTSLVFAQGIVYIESTFRIGVLHYHLHGVCVSTLPERINYTIVRDSTDSKIQEIEESLGETNSRVQEIEDSLDGIAGKVVLSYSKGDTVIFDAAAGYARYMVVGINPVIDGSGPPSPDNPRAITGWTTVTITRIVDDSQTFAIALEGAGTVYKGSLDVLNGVLTVTHKSVSARSLNWTALAGYVYTNLADSSLIKAEVLCNVCPYDVDYPAHFPMVWWGGSPESNKNLCLGITGVTNTITGWNNFLSAQDVQLVYKLQNPVTYNITPLEFMTLDGRNTVSADSGFVAIEYLMHL